VNVAYQTTRHDIPDNFSLKISYNLWYVVVQDTHVLARMFDAAIHGWMNVCMNVPYMSLTESYVTTDGQSASLFWNKAPIWGLRPDINYCLTVAGLLIWGVLSDERTGLSFALTAGPRQRSQSRVQVPSDSRPYITVSDSRLPFSSPPTTRRVTVFYPVSIRRCGNMS
jgi:hypothetical protein